MRSILVSLILRILLFILTLLVLYAYAQAEPLVVAVLDSGLDVTPETIPLCVSPPTDIYQGKHGSNVAGLIAQKAGSADYCILAIRVFKIGSDGLVHFDVLAYQEALLRLLNIKPYIINLSFGGEDELPLENFLIKQLLNNGIKVVAAAGNDGLRLEKKCNRYPACIDRRITVVGSIGSYSNYGPAVDVILDGNNRTAAGTTMSGTSQAAALYTGLVVKQELERRRQALKQVAEEKRHEN